jgi:integrase
MPLSTCTNYTIDAFLNYFIVHPGNISGINIPLMVILMTALPILLEPSFAAAIEAIETSGDLPPPKKTHWVCSLRKIAEWLERPQATIPARWTNVRISVSQLHHAQLGVTAKTLANHKANTAAALRWFGRERQVSPRGAPLLPAWAVLGDSIDDHGRKARLSGLMRYCSGMGILPPAVNDQAMTDYFAYRAATTSMATNNMAHRSVARSWNACAAEYTAWPQQRLTEPPLKTAEGPVWDDFPEGLRRDVDAYLTGLRKIRKGPKGRRARPCSPKTIKTRRAELVAVAKMALRTGIPIASLTSLVTLLQPDVVERVIEAYWKKDGDEPNIFTIELGSKLLGLARQFGLDEDAIERLQDIRDNLEEYRRGGLTPKNLALVRKVLSPGVWKGVVNLPTALMREARANLAHAPIKAALSAQLAVAVAILSFAPVRLENLVSILLNENLIKPGGLDSVFWLVFPHYDVKNRVDLQFELDNEVTDLIDEYVHDFRPHLLRGSNSACLFPGVSGQPKTANMFSSQITERIENATGLRVTVHQFRHAAAATYLRHHPGDYETVRRLLGHRNIQTTINFYCGLETTQATEAFGKIIRQQVKFETEA